MYTTYKKPTASLYKESTQDVYTTSSSPVRELIRSCTKTHTVSIAFEEDTETFTRLNNPGVIAFLCTLRKGDQVLGVGRGHTVLNAQNKYFEKLVFTSLNYSLIDSISKATRGLNTLYTEQNIPLQEVVATGYQVDDLHAPVMATEKQKSYLLELVNINVQDDKDREQWYQNIGEMTKDEASEAIQNFKN